MAVANPRDVPEYELNPLELQVRKSDGITKACTLTSSFYVDWSDSLSSLHLLARYQIPSIFLVILY